MSSINFFSMLEDNTSQDVVEIAKKRIAEQQKQPTPKPVAQDAKVKAPQGEKTQKPKEGEKTQQRPQTSQENRGRGRGQQRDGERRERPQTGEAREGGRGRGRGQQRDGQQRDGERRPPREPRGDNQDGQQRRERPPRVRKEGEGAVSAVDTTTEGDKRGPRKPHTHDANAPRRGRQFDRSVSGTGRGRGLKKGGEGAHNWGKEGDQDVRRGARTFQDKRGRSEGKVVVKGEDAPVEGVTAPLNKEGDAETVSTPVDGEAKTEAVEGEAKVEEKKKEEEVDNTLTLEEYQKQQAEKRRTLPSFGGKAVEAPVAAPAVEKKKKEVKSKEVKPGDTLSIQEFLKDRADALEKVRESERDSRGRGRGGRGSGRKQQTRQVAPNLKDEKAFPSLSGK